MQRKKMLFLVALTALATGCKKTDSNNPNPNPNPNPVTGPCSVTPEKVFFGTTEIQIDTMRLDSFIVANTANSVYSLKLISAGTAGADTTIYINWGSTNTGSEKYKIISPGDFDTARLQKASVSMQVGSYNTPGYFSPGSITGGTDSLTVKRTATEFHLCTVTDSTRSYSGNGTVFTKTAAISFDKKVAR